MIHDAHQRRRGRHQHARARRHQPDHARRRGPGRWPARPREPPAGSRPRRPGSPGRRWPRRSACRPAGPPAAPRPPPPPSAAATASARSRQPGREPEDARGGQRREREPGRRASHGSAAAAGAPRPPGPGPRGAPVVPMPEQRDRAHRRRPEHARLGPRQQHEPDHAEHAHDDQAARHARPTQRASSSRKPTTSVRLVPETASRWVSPAVRKSSTSVLGQPGVVPVDQGRHQGRAALGGCRATAVADRGPQRVRAAQQRPGPAAHDRRAAGAQHAGEVAGAGRLQPPRTSQRRPELARRHQRSSAMTSTGDARPVAPSATDHVVRASAEHDVLLEPPSPQHRVRGDHDARVDRRAPAAPARSTGLTSTASARSSGRDRDASTRDEPAARLSTAR